MTFHGVHRHPVLITMTVGVLVAGASLAFYLHREVKDEVLSQFSESQLQVARQAAGQIESYLDARSQDVRHLAWLASVQDVDLEDMPPDFLARVASLQEGYVKGVSVLDGQGQVIYSAGEPAFGTDHTRSEVYAWAGNPASREMVRVAVEKLDAPATPRVSVATPLYRAPVAGSRPGASAAFAGALAVSVDLEALAGRTILLTPAQRELPRSSIWIMDANGTLLLQSDHPEMVARNVRTGGEGCNECHLSFDYAERMLEARQGTVDYQLKGHQDKIAAFAPVKVGNVWWIVVVNAPKDSVTGFIRTHSLQTMGLLGMVGLVLGVAFFFVYRSSQQQQIIAEKADHLREKEKLVEELREAGKYLESLFDSANAPIMVWNEALRITRFNRACERLTGYAAREVIGRDLRMLFPEEGRDESLSRILPAPGGEERESPELTVLRKDGATRTVLWNSANIHTGRGARVMATVAQGQDVTERKRAELNLRVADAQLREQAALVRLGEMAAVVAHEVRNPLAGVRGVIQVIGSRLPPGSKDAAIIGDVVARLDALGELMKDLLMFARPPQMRPARVDVVALARETTALVSEDPVARDVRFEVEGSSPPIVADAKLLKIVFLNLMLNAVQALQNAGAIRTSVTASEHGCRIAVADTGPGIPPEIRERIFAPFFTTKSRGTGLGLPTAKRLVDAHHGRISVECPAGGGTVVTVDLPREQSVG